MTPKIDQVFDRLNNIDKTLSAQHVTLKEHIRRTELLEHELEPIKNKMAMATGVLKFIGLIGVLSGILEVTVMGVRWLSVR